MLIRKMINWVKCKSGHHKLIVKRYVSLEMQELHCINCKKDFAIHHGMKAFLPLDIELKYAHDVVFGLKP